jgi:hypothetical protein
VLVRVAGVRILLSVVKLRSIKAWLEDFCLEVLLKCLESVRLWLMRSLQFKGATLSAINK